MRKSSQPTVNEKLIFKAAELMNALYAAKIALETERQRFQNQKWHKNNRCVWNKLIFMTLY